MYMCLLIFVLKTHYDVVNEEVKRGSEDEQNDNRQINNPIQAMQQRNYLLQSAEFDVPESDDRNVIQRGNDDNDDDDDEEEDPMSMLGSCVLLVIATILVSIMSDFLVSSIQPMTIKLGKKK